MALIVLFAGLVMFRLTQGPITIAGISSRVAAELSARIGRGYTVDLGEATVESTHKGLTLALAGLTMKDDGARTVFEAPRAEVSVAMLPLLVGSIKPTRLELYDTDLRLVVLDDGSLAISAGAEPIVLNAPPQPATAAPVIATPDPSAPATDATPTGAMRPLAKVVADVLGVLNDQDSPLATMERVAIVRGRLILDDRVTGKTTTFDGLELSYERTGGVAKLTLAADGPSGRWSASAAVGQADARERTLDVEAHDVTFDEIALATRLQSPGFDFDVPLSAKLSLGIGTDGALLSAAGQFDIGAGYFLARDEDFEPIFVDQITGRLSWDPSVGRIVIEPSQYLAADTKITVTGSIDPPTKAGDPWTLDVRTSPGSTLDPARPNDQAVALDDASLSARIFLQDTRFVIDKFEAKGPRINAILAGEFDWAEGNRALRLNVAAKSTPVASLLRIWPTFVAAPVRGYLRDRLREGSLDNGTLTVNFDEAALDAALKKLPPADNDVHLDFTLANASLKFLPGVPSLTGINAVGHITGHTVNVNISHATLDGAQGHRLTIPDGSLIVADTTLHPSPAVVNTHFTGSLDSLGDILSRDGLKAFGGAQIDTSTMKGQVDGHIVVDLRLDKIPHPEDVPQVRATASIGDFSIDKLIGKERFDQGVLNISFDRAGMRANGQGRLFNQPAQIEMKKSAAGATDATVSFIVDDVARARMAMAFATGLSGPISGRITSSSVGKETAPVQVELDFTKANIDGVLPGLNKPAGRPGKANFRLEAETDGAHIDQLTFETSGGASIRGAIDLDANGVFKSARLSQLRLSPGDDLKLDATQEKDGLKLIARGSTVDARPFIQGMMKNDSGKNKEAQSKDIDLDLKASVVTGANRQVLSGVDLKLSRHGGFVRNVELQARSGRSPVTASTARESNGRSTISFATSDGGALLSFIDLYKRMEGGALHLDVQVSDGGVSGAVHVSDFVLRDEPALRRLVTETVAAHDEKGVAKIDTATAPFQRLSATFTRAGGELLIHDGVLYGPQIGIKLDGSLDVVRDHVNMTGTFVPVYGFNNLFTQIPLVGPILGGGTNEGLFAVNFRISGAASAPNLVINPLSAIAPGFLRKIFGVFDGTTFPNQPPGGSSADTPATIPPQR